MSVDEALIMEAHMALGALASALPPIVSRIEAGEQTPFTPDEEQALVELVAPTRAAFGAVSQAWIRATNLPAAE